jgi:transcriptional regulator of arginine metabolism
MVTGSPAAGDPAPVRTGVSPVTKAARHAQIAAILARAGSPVRSQEELAERLARSGLRVTQATLSRDLDELGAVRLRGADGGLVYALPGQPGGPGSRPGGLAAAGSAGDDRGADDSGGDGTDRGQAGQAGQGGQGGQGDQGPATGGWLNSGPMTGASGLRRVTAELLLAAEASANLVVLRTPAGAAQFLASVIDHAGWPSVLGTVAGDDTVLVIARDPAGGDDLARALLDLAEQRGHRAAGAQQDLNREPGISRRKS